MHVSGARRLGGGAGRLGCSQAAAAREDPQQPGEREPRERDPPAAGESGEAAALTEAVHGLDEHHRPFITGQVEREPSVVGAREQPVLKRRCVGQQLQTPPAERPLEQQRPAGGAVQRRAVAGGVGPFPFARGANFAYVGGGRAAATGRELARVCGIAPFGGACKQRGQLVVAFAAADDEPSAGADEREQPQALGVKQRVGVEHDHRVSGVEPGAPERHPRLQHRVPIVAQ